MTTLRDIVVVLDDPASSEMRLTVAVVLAQQHGAHLTGFSALDLLLPARPAPRLVNWGAALPHEADTQAAEAAERIEAAFRERPRFTELHGDWQVASGKVNETVVCQARHADLVILGRVDPAHPPPVPTDYAIRTY